MCGLASNVCVASPLIAASLCKQLNRPGTAVRRHASYADEAVKQVYKSTNWKEVESGECEKADGLFKHLPLVR